MPDEVRVVALLHAKPGEEDAVRRAALRCVAPTRAEAGCEVYEAHQDTKDPALLVFV